MDSITNLSKRKPPPPIPKRNPNTCLSTSSHTPTTTLLRPLDHEKARKSSYYHRQINATLPRRHKRLDVCTELLNYISELTQELMAETSFTEVSSFEEATHRLPMRSSWPYSRSQSSVAIQTEEEEETELKRNVTRPRSGSEGVSIGVQVTKTNTPELEENNGNMITSPDSNKAFREIRKMLKEGSIEGIEDDPPVFKPPPPPVTPPVQRIEQSNVVARSDIHTSTLGPRVRRCLSTFEPSNNTEPLIKNNKEARKIDTATMASRKKKVTMKTTQLTVEPQMKMERELIVEQKRRKQPNTSNMASKSATVDRCIRKRLSPALIEKQRHTMRTPPPPPSCKDPPPKIVVEVPNSKHRQNSSCGTTCSCLCLKRQSPCGSPVPSMGSLPSISPPHASPVPKNKVKEITHLSPDAPNNNQQEAYNALIAEIRAAIKQRQIGPKTTEDN